MAPKSAPVKAVSTDDSGNVTVTIGDATTPVPAMQDDMEQHAPEDETALATPPAMDWSAMTAPVAMPTKQAFPGVRANVLKTVPEPIRQRAEQSLTVNTERVAKRATSTAKRARVNYHWDLQAVTSIDMGAAFIKLVTRYAKYRPAGATIPHAGPNSPPGQVTVRCGDPSYYRKTEADSYAMCDKGDEGAFIAVRYSVRPFEKRRDAARAPGTA